MTRNRPSWNDLLRAVLARESNSSFPVGSTVLYHCTLFLWLYVGYRRVYRVKCHHCPPGGSTYRPTDTICYSLTVWRAVNTLARRATGLTTTLSGKNPGSVGKKQKNKKCGIRKRKWNWKPPKKRKVRKSGLLAPESRRVTVVQFVVLSVWCFVFSRWWLLLSLRVSTLLDPPTWVTWRLCCLRSTVSSPSWDSNLEPPEGVCRCRWCLGKFTFCYFFPPSNFSKLVWFCPVSPENNSC